MKIWRTIAEVEHNSGPTGFVPTMGAFHEGHLTLMRRAKSECGFCVVSLFVNPTQFGPKDDFNRYPRDEDADLEMARSAGVDAIFAPSVEEIYRVSTAKIVISRVSEAWEGVLRPGHFDGVATVVCKLFNIIRPSHAYFGLKDFQQCAVVSALVESLDIPLELICVPTVREEDGLALSSRNRYLSVAHRKIAPEVYASLRTVSERIRKGDDVASSIEDAKVRLTKLGFEVQYLALIDSKSLLPINNVREDNRLIIAAKMGDTRLIDNIRA